jgi:uncharacterized protein YcfJ
LKKASGAPELTCLTGIVPEINRRTLMKWFLATACAAVLLTASVIGADAKGCIKGAIVGGVAGHMAGHGKMGAAAGCVIGHHEANKHDPNNANAQAPAPK